MYKSKNSKIAILLPSLSSGGVATSILKIANRFSSNGYHVDLLITKSHRKYMVDVPRELKLIELQPSSQFLCRIKAFMFDPFHPGKWIIPFIVPSHIDRNIRAIPSLIHYLRNFTPDMLLTAPTYTNIVALISKKLAFVKTQVTISEHSILSQEIEDKAHRLHWQYVSNLVAKTYPLANNIIAVSDGVKRDLASKSGIQENVIHTVYNPVISNQVDKLRDQSINHPWFNDPNTPVLLGVGRLLQQKDWPTLLKAFAYVREYSAVKLVIFGEGSQRKNLEQLAIDLNIRDHIDLPGYTENPYAYMAKADVFVLSSKYEGLGNVIIEALACGCPVVSTDCPSGPGEILQDGEFGRLVPVGDPEALSQAILKSLFEKTDTTNLRNRAWDFSVERAYQRYRQIMLNE